jgi:ATPase subunit of ABC transporter with duplicated ATPase domains
VYDTISGGSDEVDLNGRKVNARAYCSWYNFKSADQQKKVGVLSGEETCRLVLGQACPNFLLAHIGILFRLSGTAGQHSHACVK